MSDTFPVQWRPSESFIAQSNLTDYQNWLARESGLRFDSYEALWEWSTEHPADFWESLWSYFQLNSRSPYQSVLSGQMPHAEWFTGATLNYAEQIFQRRKDDQAAIIFVNEVKEEHISWDRLTQEVAAIQEWLRSCGVQPGDRVAAYLPNIPEAISCFLATVGLGAVWSCCSPDFGVDTVIERFSQIEPKVFITCDGYQYNGKPYDRTEESVQIQQQIPSLEATALVQYLHTESVPPNMALYRDLCTCAPRQKPHFEAVPFNHPIWILYSSGTTGKPKAITHGHGGVLLEHLKYMHFHNDVKPGENFFWFTTTGWMMWNFLQSSMLAGATPVLYDGSPAYPDMNRLWQLAEKLPIHHFGTSAPYLIACQKRGLEVGKDFDLSALRSIGSTGAPLPPSAFEWVQNTVSKDVWLCSMSGGTDVCTAFVGGNPWAPVRTGLIQCRALGCALHAYDEDGNPVIGSLGEMVIEKPMPSMPIYFWNDPDNERYHNSYFSTYPGKWRHGDWIKIFEDGQLIIQGRSDATLNRKGVRIGTAEIYRVLDHITGIKDSLILNLEQNDGSDYMPLFIVTDDSVESLGEHIRVALKTQCSPRHVPDDIILVPDIPYTLSGKKMEVPVKKILIGMDISKTLNRDAVRNPEALDWFIDYAKLRS